mmetsp:Transcript_86830/g.269963  ORF Transcript_86830/g.269963 Transcript_86830/m.269963 type:complete len:238 (-) Transcript_86830:977-1690(-)
MDWSSCRLLRHQGPRDEDRGVLRVRGLVRRDGADAQGSHAGGHHPVRLGRQGLPPQLGLLQEDAQRLEKRLEDPGLRQVLLGREAAGRLLAGPGPARDPPPLRGALLASRGGLGLSRSSVGGCAQRRRGPGTSPGACGVLGDVRHCGLGALRALADHPHRHRMRGPDPVHVRFAGLAGCIRREAGRASDAQLRVGRVVFGAQGAAEPPPLGARARLPRLHGERPRGEQPRRARRGLC